MKRIKEIEKLPIGYQTAKRDVTKTGNGERGTGNGERETGNEERGTGNGEPGTGVWEQVYSGNPLENSKWQSKKLCLSQC